MCHFLAKGPITGKVFCEEGQEIIGSRSHISQVQGEWGSNWQRKQNLRPQEQVGSQCTSESALQALISLSEAADFLRKM